MGEVAHVGAAVFLAGGHAEQAHVAEFFPQVGGEFVDAVDLRRTRRDFGVGERLDRVAQQVDVFAEAEVEAGNVHGFAPWDFSGLPCMTMTVCCISAHCVFRPSLIAKTSPWVTISVRPVRITLPNAIR